MRKHDGRHGTADSGIGHGFDLAAAAAQGPLIGADQTNGVVDVTEDHVDEQGSEYTGLIQRLGAANIAGIGSIV